MPQAFLSVLNQFQAISDAVTTTQEKIPLKARVETYFEKRAKISQLNWRLAKIGATFQATNQNKTLLPCVYSNYTPQSGQKYLRNFFRQCALPKATKLFPNQRLPTNA